ncbi:NUDIX domain-containing protein [Candidatus Woesearchaeota archaeon]|nr:NUDIX domain-containing protein [Candidatus Woesearchaeota archaeon]
MPEMIIEVDEDDNIIGYRPKPDFPRSRYIHRGSHLFLFNRKGEFLLALRGKRKKVYPDTWENAASGTVPKGETYEETMVREAYEELGISVTGVRFLFRMFCSDEIDKAWHEYFAARHEGPFILEEDGVQEVRWVTLSRLREDMTKNPAVYTPPFIDSMLAYFERFGTAPPF